MHEPDATRRQFLGLAGGMAALSVMTVPPIEATPSMLATAIRDVVGAAIVQTGKVKLDIPPLVENGNTVPMTVSVTSPMTSEEYVKSIHVFNEKNPQTNIGKTNTLGALTEVLPQGWGGNRRATGVAARFPIDFSLLNF